MAISVVWTKEKARVEYLRLHAQAEFWLERFWADAHQPERFRSSIEWCARMADERLYSEALTVLQEALDCAREPWMGSVQNPDPLVDVDPSTESYIRPMRVGRYFEDAAGGVFIPIGYNHNPDWPRLMESNPLVPREGNQDARSYDPSVTIRWFAHLAEYGVNLVRMMVETPQNGNLEDPVGRIQPEHVRWLDHVVSAARQAGIRLMVTPYDTFWMNLKWSTSTYSPIRGGIVRQKLDWYLSPEVREAQKRRMRFLIDRYGNLGTIFCWELMNEADLWWGATPAQISEWADEMVAFVREYERAKWGRNHMVTVSTAAATPRSELADFAFQRDDFEFATTHLYIGRSKAPREPLSVIQTTERGVRHALRHLRDRRPYMDSENGPIDRWIRSERLDDEVHHNQSWAHLCSGGAGSSLRWPYRRPHHLTPGMLQTLQAMSQFCSALDWRKLTGEARRLRLQWPQQSVGTSFVTDQAALLFVTCTGGDPLQVPSLGAGTTRLFNTRKGVWLDGSTGRCRSVAVYHEF